MNLFRPKAAPAQAKTPADEFRETVFEWLKNEGYVPLIDDDGDIQFKFEGDNFCILLWDTGKESGFTYVELAVIYEMDEADRAMVADAANEANANMKLVRTGYICVPDGKSVSEVKFEVPCYVADAGEFTRLFEQYLECIRGARSSFFKSVEESEGKRQ
jgi:hypothetical protein